ncbi:MAG: pyrroline-5-carboxylate reductase [Thermomicrobiales bacterium]
MHTVTKQIGSVAFIGAGAMAEAMLAGMLARGVVQPGQVSASHPRAGRRDELHGRYGVTLVEENREAARGADLVVLTVKPQVVRGVLADLREVIAPEQVVLSIAAGMPLTVIVNGLGGHGAAARAMPNTPAQIGEGVSVWATTASVTDAQRAMIGTALGALGHAHFVEDEKLVDMATALSGTGPTYIFLVMEALIDAGVHLGFSRHLAEQLVIQTMSGSVAFAAQSHKHPAELRNLVTSPGGTSAEAIYQMEKGGLRTVLSKAVHAAYERTVTLRKAQEQD